MAYFLRNALTKLRHKGPKSQLERCPYCDLVVVNTTCFPWEMCVGPPDDPHKPVAAQKL